MSNLINPVTQSMAKELNLTYQEMEEVEKIYFRIPKKQRTLETLKQLAQEIKAGKTHKKN